MRAFTIRTILLVMLCFTLMPRAVAGADEPATPVAATEVPSDTPVATGEASTPVATGPVATEETVAAASDPIILTLNGVSRSLFVKVGTPVTVDASPGGMWFFLYYGSGCQGDRYDFFKKAPFTMNETVTASVMAFDPNVDYMHPSGPCLDITWAAPTLFLNGEPRGAFLTLDSELTATASPANMKINVFGGSGCEPQRLITTANSGYHVTQPEAGTASLQAFDPADPTNVSPCLDATWDSFTPPAQPVELLLNGKSESITVFNNHLVTMSTSPSNLLLRVYDGPNCTGRPVVHQSPFNQVQPTATSQSAQAFDPNHPANPSACLNIVWKTPVITVNVNSWYGDHRSYYPGVYYYVKYSSEDPGITILARFYRSLFCGSFPQSAPAIELSAAPQETDIQQLFKDNPSQFGGWSIQAYDPLTGNVSACIDITQGKIFEEEPVTPEVPMTAEPSNPAPTPSTGAVTTLPNTGDGPADSQSATAQLLGVFLLFGSTIGILSCMSIRRRRS